MCTNFRIFLVKLTSMFYHYKNQIRLKLENRYHLWAATAKSLLSSFLFKKRLRGLGGDKLRKVTRKFVAVKMWDIYKQKR